MKTIKLSSGTEVYLLKAKLSEVMKAVVKMSDEGADQISPIIDILKTSLYYSSTKELADPDLVCSTLEEMAMLIEATIEMNFPKEATVGE
ncbi:MAG: hypothetical protein LBH98_04280 [Chitinispirillales bacterium]|jgi:hypothetical protein|nr:hypothetical protein [Chitinispirillales bacterium]